MIWIARLLRFAVLLTSIYVLFSIIPISVSQLREGGACPILAGVPACYVVTVAYSLIAVGTLATFNMARWLYLAGITPIVGLASAGSALEWFGVPTCPRSPSGLPLCYASLILGLILLGAILAVLWIERPDRL